jgi:hypothetical protein
MFNTDNAKPVSTALANHFRLSITQCLKTNDEVKDMSNVPYASVVRVFNVCYGLYKTRFDTCSQCGELVSIKSGIKLLRCSQMDLQILEGYYKIWYHV